MGYTDDRRDSLPEPSAPPLTPRTREYLNAFVNTDPSAPPPSDDGNSESDTLLGASAPRLTEQEEREYFLFCMTQAAQQRENPIASTPAQFETLDGRRILSDIRTRQDAELISLMTLQLRASYTNKKKSAKQHKRYQKAYKKLIHEREKLLSRIETYVISNESLSEKQEKKLNKQFNKLYKSTGKKLNANDKKTFRKLTKTHTECIDRFLKKHSDAVLMKKSNALQNTKADNTVDWNNEPDSPWHCWYGGSAGGPYYYDSFYYCDPLGIGIMTDGIIGLIKLNTAAFHNTMQTADTIAKTVGPVMHNGIVEAAKITEKAAQTAAGVVTTSASSISAFPDFAGSCLTVATESASHAINAGTEAASSLSHVFTGAANELGDIIKGAGSFLTTIPAGIVGIFSGGSSSSSSGDDAIVMLAIAVIAVICVVVLAGAVAAAALGAVATVLTLGTLKNLAIRHKIRSQLGKLLGTTAGFAIGSVISAAIGGSCGFGLAWALGALGGAIQGTQFASVGAILGACGTHIGSIIGIVIGIVLGAVGGVAIGGGSGAISSATIAYAVNNLLKNNVWQLTNKQQKKLIAKDFDIIKVETKLQNLKQQYEKIERENGVIKCNTPLSDQNKELSNILKAVKAIKSGKMKTIKIRDEVSVNTKELKHDRDTQFTQSDSSAIKSLKQFMIRKTARVNQHQRTLSENSYKGMEMQFNHSDDDTIIPESPKTSGSPTTSLGASLQSLLRNASSSANHTNDNTSPFPNDFPGGMPTNYLQQPSPPI